MDVRLVLSAAVLGLKVMSCDTSRYMCCTPSAGFVLTSFAVARDQPMLSVAGVGSQNRVSSQLNCIPEISPARM